MALYFLIIASYQTLPICELTSSPYLQYHLCYKRTLKKKICRQLCIIIKEEHLYKKVFYSASCPFVTTKHDLREKSLFFLCSWDIREKGDTIIVKNHYTNRPLQNAFPIPHTFRLQYNQETTKDLKLSRIYPSYASPDFIVCPLSRSSAWRAPSQVLLTVKKPLIVPKEDILPASSHSEGKHSLFCIYISYLCILNRLVWHSIAQYAHLDFAVRS